MSEIKKTLLKNTSWTFIGTAFMIAAGACSHIIIGNVFGVSNLGIYALALTIYIAVTPVALLGLDTALIKYVAQYRRDEKIISRYLSGGLFIAFLFGILSVGILFLLTQPIADFFGMPRLFKALRIISYGLPFFFISKILLCFLNGLKKMKVYSIFESSRYILIIVITLIAVFLRDSFFETLWAYPIAEIAISIGLVIYLWNRFEFSLRKTFREGIELVVYGWPLVFSRTLGLLAVRLDLLMVAFFLTEREVGIYAVVVMVANGMRIFIRPLQMITSPMITEYYYDNEHVKMQIFVNRVIRYTFIFYSLLAIIVWGCIALILSIMYPAKFEYMSSVIPLQILSIGLIFRSVVRCVAGTEAQSTGRPKIALYRSLLVLGTNFMLNLILIPKYKLIGAAIATAISYIVVFVFSSILRTKLLKIKLELHIWAYSFLIFIFILVGMQFIGVWVNPLMNTIFFILIYSIIIYFSKLIEPNDLKFLKNLLFTMKNKSL